MTAHVRRTWFYALTLLFVISAIGLLFYSNGWRLDLETFQINKFGALFVEATIPSDISLAIEKTNIQLSPGLLRNGTLIANLFPKTYLIQAQKSGYQTWSKNFSIKPSLVTRTYPIVLVPERTPYSLIDEHAQNVWAGSRYLAWQNSDATLTINNHIVRGQRFIEWSDSGSSAITAEIDSTAFFLTNITQNTAATNISVAMRNLTGATVEDARFKPGSATTVIVQTNTGIYSLDLNRYRMEKLAPAGLVLSENSRALFAVGTSSIIALNLDTTYRDEALAILHDRLLTQPHALFQLSPDGTKLAFNNQFEPGVIRVYFLNDDETLNKKAGEFVMIDSGFKDLNMTFAWHSTSYFLYLLSNHQLFFSEIDNRLPLNKKTIAEVSDSFSVNNAGDLYSVASGALYKLDLR